MSANFEKFSDKKYFDICKSAFERHIKEYGSITKELSSLENRLLSMLKAATIPERRCMGSLLFFLKDVDASALKSFLPSPEGGGVYLGGIVFITVPPKLYKKTEKSVVKDGKFNMITLNNQLISMGLGVGDKVTGSNGLWVGEVFMNEHGLGLNIKNNYDPLPLCDGCFPGIEGLKPYKK